MMQQISRSQPTSSVLLRSLRSFCASTETNSSPDKIVAAVVFERLPIVVPKIHPTYYMFQQFAFRWGKIQRPEKKKDEKKHKQVKSKVKQPDQIQDKLDSMPKGDYKLEFKRVPWSGNADEDNNRRSPFRALDRKLYLLLYGSPPGNPTEKPIWHFPEKTYEAEKTLLLCARSALRAVIGDSSYASFVANAPMGHLALQQNEGMPDSQTLKRFFFKSQVVGLNKFQVENCEDHVWVTKDELLEYFPEQEAFLKKMIIS
ncbi:hypothetical protein ZOSMA_42G00260 [Zostera marina]|uniref:Large ribosomal subunit protein mL46 n=1 Tax=Zostera marina TaxID=29655 RepID=A0A0K9P467_ZOSMR|nr:hypothetical protein ZOSMA_42G00260 [Zostera marina]